MKAQGQWEGYELVNCGGHLEWLQASIGSEMYTYFNGKHYYLKVEKGMHPSKAWTEYQLDDMLKYSPESFQMVPFLPALEEFCIRDEESA